MRAQMRTQRLHLRWLHQDDARAVQAGCNNWNVAKMLARVPHPYPDGLAEDWIAGQAAIRARNDGATYAVTLDGTLIGVMGIDRIEDGHGSGTNLEIGYWLDEPFWGRGYATEAGQAAIAIAFADFGAPHLTSGHFTENTASGKVLEKLGFAYTGTSTRPCTARGHDMPAREMRMPRSKWAAGLITRSAEH
jgi:8-oxo-dGTP diphosphatase